MTDHLPVATSFDWRGAGKIPLFAHVNFSRCFVLGLFFLLAPVAVFAAAARGKSAAPTPRAGADDSKGAIVIDAETGNVLFEDRADTVAAPASMTKLMTFAVLHDKLAAGALSLDTLIEVTAADSNIGGSQVWLKEHEVFPVQELLYAMMVHSANDAAYALARTAAGSVDAFVELMNRKAQELGMTHTTFRSPHGLPPETRRTLDGDVSTPRDFALLCRELLRHTDVLAYTSIRTRDFGTGVRPQPVAMVNSDHLVGRVPGVDGLKTGYTRDAGFCLSATAQRNGRRVLVVSMGSPTSKARDRKVTELLEFGFAALPPKPVVPTIQLDGPAPVATTPKQTADRPQTETLPPLKFPIPKRATR
jgi:D-alanyl-D-alanine carboxypeptidase (penicillin-binding protein 5/6)